LIKSYCHEYPDIEEKPMLVFNLIILYFNWQMVIDLNECQLLVGENIDNGWLSSRSIRFTVGGTPESINLTNSIRSKNCVAAE
jgi:hypothetical protein